MRALVAIVTCWLFGCGLILAEGHGSIPVLFFANQGQAPEDVRFLAKTRRINALFSDRKAEFIIGADIISLEFQDARQTVRVESDAPLTARANFFFGDDPAKWRRNVALVEHVIYRGLYRGIDMSFGGTGSLLKSEFLLKPGADAGAIRLRYSGAKSVSLSSDGSLVFELESSEVREAPPIVYQDIRGRRVPVAASYSLQGNGVVGFDVEEYDSDWPLVIDPAISYSTYLGGSGIDGATSVAIDGLGSAYVVGYTESTDFPIAGALQGGNAGSVDAFVVKFSADGKSLVYATLIGGSGDDRAFGIAVDPTGSAIVTGWTSSTNFPNVNAFQATNGGGRDAFVLKLNPTGSVLIYSTFLGGSGADSGNAIATDSSGNAYVAGDTTSANFPVLSAFQATNNGRQEAFVAKINTAGAVQFATYLGGAGDDRGLGIAVDSAGAIYVSGGTTSPNFPLANAFQATNGGGQDAFASKLASNGASLTYSTYLGGACGGPGEPEQANGIAVDAAGNAYVVGVTCSLNFPLAAPLQTGHGGGLLDAFVTKLNPAGSSLVYSTYLGGLGLDTGTAIAVDSAGNVFVTGNTASSTFPLVNAIQTTKTGPYDAFVAQINPPGNALTLSTFLGGSGSDGGTSIKVDSAGGVWVVGQTTSTDFPLVTAYQPFGLTEGNGFVTKLVVGGTPGSSVTPSTGTGSSQTFQFVFTDPAGASDLASVVVIINNGLNGANACYFYASPSGTVNLQSDSGTWLTLTPGSGSVQNSECILTGTGASFTSAGTTWTLTLPISFKPLFAGARSTYAYINDRAGHTPGWQQIGTWTVPGTAVAPTETVTPSAGTAASQSFQFTITDTNGSGDIGGAVIIINSGLNGTNGCYFYFDAVRQAVSLASNDGSTWSQLGTSGTIQNTQCTINSQGAGITASGNNIVLTLPITFPSTFLGVKGVYMQTASRGGTTSGWQQVGSWTVPGTPVVPTISLSPSSGTGTTAVLALTITDTNGALDIASVAGIVNAFLDGSNSCYFFYTNGGTIQLLADNGQTWLAVSPGGTGSIQNSRCGISGPGSSVSISGNSVVLHLAFTFTKATFSGVKNVYFNVGNNESMSTGWLQKGTWTVQ